MEDDTDALLRVLDPDPQRAAHELLRLSDKLFDFFRWRRCVEPADLVQETILRATRKAKEGFPPDANPAGFIFGIAKNVMFETKRTPPTISLDQVAASQLPIMYSDPDTAILLQQYLSRLPPGDAQLLVRYYREDRTDLALELGVKESTLRVRVFRIRQGLEASLRTQHRRET